jgi:hypothetical protein
MARTVHPASPLAGTTPDGYAAEVATHDAAATWGLPDFVFPGATIKKGSGSTRELGDTILVVGEYAVVVQVKSRSAPSSDDGKERRWLLKKATTALSQGSGTIRTMATQSFELVNARGRTVMIDGSAHRWLVAVVLDHESPPDDVVPAVALAKHPSVVLLRRDWEFLFEQLKSTHAVAGYLARVAGEDNALGGEPSRYYDKALADDAAEPTPLDAMLGPGTAVSVPMLPLAPAGTDDRRAHETVREILEDIATTGMTSPNEDDRLRMLAELDRLPIGHRAEAGRFLLSAMAELRQDAPGADARWGLRSFKGGRGQPHVAFGVCSHAHTPELQEYFGLWAQLRHHDLLAVRGEDDALTTVAVLLTPRTSGRRRWDTLCVAVSGPTGFTNADLAALRNVWPTAKAA